MICPNPKRVVVWFSCGATSAVAAKITASQYQDTLPVHLVYTDPGSEHPDNHRFLKDVEKWVGLSVQVLKSEKYVDTWDVFEKTRYLAGINGARCTLEMKTRLRQNYENLGEDIQVFGYDAGEPDEGAAFIFLGSASGISSGNPGSAARHRFRGARLPEAGALDGEAARPAERRAARRGRGFRLSCEQAAPGTIMDAAIWA